MVTWAGDASLSQGKIFLYENMTSCFLLGFSMQINVSYVLQDIIYSSMETDTVSVSLFSLGYRCLKTS